MGNHRFLPKVAAVGLLGLFTVPGSFATLSERARPNIILIIADDLGMGDLGCYGAKDISSPNIDQVANNGVRFDRNYAYPVCSPSRASMLTGKFPEQLGISSALMGEGGLAVGTQTMAHRFKAAGYRTALIGKWHLGYDLARGPNRMGFDRFFGFRGGKIDYFTHRDTAQKDDLGNPLGKHDLWRDELEVHRDGSYTTQLFTSEAVNFIREQIGDPFFLTLAYNAPHYARPGVLQAPDDYIRKFAVNPAKPTSREIYRAMVSCMDDGVGEILAALKERGLTEKTLVIFASDNGSDPKSGGSNGVLREGKWSVYEGGIRVPLMAIWPGKIAPSVQDAVLHCADLLPTLLSAAGIPHTRGEFSGVDAWATFLNQEPTATRTLMFQFRNSRAVIDGKWKLVAPVDGRITGRLYDVSADPAESVDRSLEYPDVAAKLSKLLPP
ncbi:MAG: sulfatase-like hydrolase/transferase [Opitutae bacterium]|nr:sulfatase-like hydrolase/transferase [Opitutae bacterium]